MLNSVGYQLTKPPSCRVTPIHITRIHATGPPALHCSYTLFIPDHRPQNQLTFWAVVEE